METSFLSYLEILNEFKKNPDTFDVVKFENIKEEILRKLEPGYRKRFSKLGFYSIKTDITFEDIPF